MTDTNVQTGAGGIGDKAAVPGTDPAGELGPVSTSPPDPEERRASLAADAWRELRRSPVFWISSAIIAVYVAIAIAPGLFSSIDAYDSNQCVLSESLASPSSEHWFGRDFQGCDVYANIIYGTRNSLAVGFVVVFATFLIGGPLGAIAGFYGGLTDSILSRILDIFNGIPYFLAGLIILVTLDLPSIWGVVLALTLFGWMSTARIARSAVISVRDADFVSAARSLGASRMRILLRHVVPNALAPVIVVTTISLGGVVAAEATYSFLGIGVKPPTISWGLQIADAQQYWGRARHILFFPAGALSLAVLSFILLGEAVRDALDPKLR
ncbi:ABC transporter permease [Motilibacter aurantiacus]|uniref:ABC transporter permease n=1 Tax=Motilibacter aurantiacus TaxID=2714955 RepID=UPI00140CAAF5|nr:ABC transporter permease [Motilibacter aurantiacus]NHC45761.1 ABC transporter permease [Motilibacter aurantiacus]